MKSARKSPEALWARSRRAGLRETEVGFAGYIACTTRREKGTRTGATERVKTWEKPWDYNRCR